MFSILAKAIAFLFLINILFAGVLIFVERKNPTVTWAWLIVLMFMPGIGFILYLFIGQNLRRKHIFDRKTLEEELMDLFVTKQMEMLNSNQKPVHQKGMERHLDLIQFNLRNNKAVYTENNEVLFFNDGNDKFKKMMEDIRNATNFIHIEYYIIRGDGLGTTLINLLTQKAKQGVEVKILGDGMGTRFIPKHFFDELIEADGEIAIFFPPYLPIINVRINYRNHRKICIIDGKCAYVGGLNIGDEYLSRDRKKFGNWRDAHVRISGSAVESLQLRFFMDWRFASKKDIIFDLKYFPVFEPRKDGVGIQILYSGPDTRSSAIKNNYFKMINEAEKSIYIETPYFVPDDSIFEALRIAALSGVDIRIIIPNKPDHPFVYWVNRSYAGELMEAGVRFYYYQDGFVHSKLIIVDGVMCSIGSANMDIRSFETNFEVNAVLYHQAFTSHVEQCFLDDLNNSVEFTLEEYKQQGKIRNAKESISRLLAPLL